ncbi:hypothetical protein [Martelella mediterranea]|nr:hypothetical protein [Martelella mediterranea]
MFDKKKSKSLPIYSVLETKSRLPPKDDRRNGAEMFMKRAKVAGATPTLGTIATPVLHARALTRDVFEFLSEDDPDPSSRRPLEETEKQSERLH